MYIFDERPDFARLINQCHAASAMDLMFLIEKSSAPGVSFYIRENTFGPRRFLDAYDKWKTVYALEQLLKDFADPDEMKKAYLGKATYDFRNPLMSLFFRSEKVFEHFKYRFQLTIIPQDRGRLLSCGIHLIHRDETVHQYNEALQDEMEKNMRKMSLEQQ